MMAKRSIKDAEIALIKAMLQRGMKNSVIQFHFNRPDRPVNSGRITTIRDNTYGDSASIAAATDQELDAFFSRIVAPASASPLDASVLQSMFELLPDGRWRLKDGESDDRECKANFGLKHAHQWVKAAAALANNRGGYIFIGVADKGAEGSSGEDLSDIVIGMENADFETIDAADITNKLKSLLEPTPRASRTTIEVGGKRVGVLHVERHPGRPVIATNGDGKHIREGDIFYRYPGQSSRIGYGDLRALLDERDAQARRDILPQVARLLELGPHRALLADLATGELLDGRTTIMIDPKLIEQINFIREGSFDEVDGAPALKLVGEVVGSSDPDDMSSRGAITDDTLLRNFLKQVTIGHPREYIRYAAGAGHASWLPLRYFAQLGGLDLAGAISTVRKAEGTASRKNALIAKLQNPAAARHTFPGSPKAIASKLKSGEVVEPTDAKSASQIAQAICGLDDLTALSGPVLLGLLERCRSLLARQPAMSHARRAACRVDELMYPLAN
jgi:hypothetical protein